MSSGLCVSSRVVSANGDNDTVSANGDRPQPVFMTGKTYRGMQYDQPKQHRRALCCLQ